MQAPVAVLPKPSWNTHLGAGRAPTKACCTAASRGASRALGAALPQWPSASAAGTAAAAAAPEEQQRRHLRKQV
jgi:hypothetical protein